eukprot:3666651-Alexandrium_andersonii.AAC.1
MGRTRATLGHCSCLPCGCAHCRGGRREREGEGSARTCGRPCAKARKGQSHLCPVAMALWCNTSRATSKGALGSKRSQPCTCAWLAPAAHCSACPG